jgi:hypothetical protein
LHDGAVSICCNNHSRKSLIGHLDERSLIDIWNCDTYSKLRQLHLRDRFDEIELCSGCFFTDVRIEWMLQDTLQNYVGR